MSGYIYRGNVIELAVTTAKFKKCTNLKNIPRLIVFVDVYTCRQGLWQQPPCRRWLWQQVFCWQQSYVGALFLLQKDPTANSFCGKAPLFPYFFIVND
jgi:hypothetical protein